MKNTAKCTFGLVLLVVCVICMGSVFAEEKSVFDEGRGPGKPEMTKERVEMMLDKLAEHDPQRAEELRQLHAENPEAFREEMKSMRKRKGQDGKGGPGEGDGPEGKRGPGGQEPDAARVARLRMERAEYSRGMGQDRNMQQFTEWLEKNYPEKAEELAELKKDNPQMYGRKLSHIAKTYGPIMGAEKNNPELAEVLKEDIELKGQRDELLKELRETEDEDEIEELEDELREVIEERFDLIIRKRELRYEELEKKIEQLREQLEKQQAEVEKLEDQKDDQIEKRVEELLSYTEKINWQ